MKLACLDCKEKFEVPEAESLNDLFVCNECARKHGSICDRCGENKSPLHKCPVLTQDANEIEVEICNDCLKELNDKYGVKPN